LRKLAIDIGNTRTKIGIFEHKNLLEKVAKGQFSTTEIIDLANHFDAKYLIISSVAAPDPVFVATLSHHFHLVELSADTPLPFINTYRTPQTLGKDRLAAVAGAMALFPQQNCLVVDGGTCIKYELLTADGRFLGGNIAPGLLMRTKAMAHFTARLPVVDLDMPTNAVGDSTETALQNGAFRGTILEIQGFYALYASELGSELSVILTGGDAEFLNKYLSFTSQVVQNDLTLIGLNEILDLNIKHFSNT
jgi:type III pantothenate kinase